MLTERQYALPWQSLTLCTAKSNVRYTHIKQPLFRSKLPSLRLGIATPPPGAWRGRKPARKYCIIKTTKKSIGSRCRTPQNHPSLHVCPDVRRRDHSKATYYLAEVMRARARHSLAGDGRSHPLPILQRKFFRLGVLVSDRGAFLCQFNYALLKDLTVFLSSCLVGILGPGAPAAISAYVAVNDPLFPS